MFGTNDNQAVMGSPSVQNPSMLDNVSSTDFQATEEASNQSNTPAQSSAAQPVSPDPVTTVHTMTTDNPFVQNPIAGPVADTTTPGGVPPPTFTTIPSADDATTSPSAPVSPPAPVMEDTTSQSSYLAALSDDDKADTEAKTPVDQAKLADMKQEALAHLEPLAEHIDGTPEERFKTTMMMIQANDNHLLLDKALEAAKSIEDDKIRAQAMLDIINEINYFSQVTDN